MMKKALEKYFLVDLLIDEKETILRTFYHSLGFFMLKHEWAYKYAGKRIAKKIINNKPDVAILLMDVSAGAIPYLKEKGICVILSVEDLTAEWLNLENKEKVLSFLEKYAVLSDKVIVISNELQTKLAKIGIKACVVPPGLEEIYVDFDYALDRLNGFESILHAGKLQFKEEVESFYRVVKQISEKYKLKSYFVDGKCYRFLKEQFPFIEWYNYPSAEVAATHVRDCFAGLIIRFKTHNPARLYYHASMLQPVIGVGDTWLSAITRNKIGVISTPNNVLQSIETILNDYQGYVNNVYKFAKKNTLENAYSPLIRFLHELDNGSRN
jgi:ribose 5-phosphate isomerase RpiB